MNHPQTFVTTREPTSEAPPNMHGDKLFLVKIQAGMGTETTMLIYDRNRTFKEVFFFLEDDPETHAAVLAEIRGPRGGYGGLKMYRWAKRTGDRQLSICLDRPPTMPIAW